jgi:succinate-semialdehyde dehydrogenase/glutarate-semialdehyde dehydrogenase
LYTNLFISGKRASALVSDKRIKGVSLTGSEKAGASIATEAGKHLKKVVLELGGNDVFIILEDADMTKTVEWAVVGRMNNNGQSCIASRRFIAVEAVADEFIHKFKDAFYKLTCMQPNAEQFNAIAPMGQNENIKSVVDNVYSLENSVEACEYLATGRAKGKVIVSLS